MKFYGMVSLVTGGGGGIGAAVAGRLAEQGAKVVIADFDAAGGRAVAQSIESAGGQAVFRKVDITDEHSVDGLISGIVNDFGRLDLAHNNAGILHKAVRLHELSSSDWERSITVNATGTAHCLRAEISAMLEAGSGSIVNTASGAGLGAAPNISAYAASKHAVVGLTKAAALEYIREGIRVNAVAPGTVETAMTAGMPDAQREALNELMPMGRMATPNEVAAGVEFLLSPGASYINGVILPIDGGSSASA